jgi:hypothetical protein
MVHCLTLQGKTGTRQEDGSTVTVELWELDKVGRWVGELTPHSSGWWDVGKEIWMQDQPLLRWKTNPVVMVTPADRRPASNHDSLSSWTHLPTTVLLRSVTQGACAHSVTRWR